VSSARLRLVVTGLSGQVVSALIERCPRDIEIIAVGRPQLDLAHRDAVIATLRAARCDAIINAAAYTAVDRAESEPDVAMRINGDGAGHVAEAAAALGAPLLHLSTDYVFDGELLRPYTEEDATSPSGAYGRSKLAGERQIAARHDNHIILRTAWIYSPYGANFVKTMLRAGETRAEVSVVADQTGNPTCALDIADTLIVIARRMISDASPELRGVFHMSGGGDATWADFAEAIFAASARHSCPVVRVNRIATADYPTPARRPKNSRLDNRKLKEKYDVSLPQWRLSTDDCVRRILQKKTGK
jgi:dTDP-4-dehydrorhamnose reductase